MGKYVLDLAIRVIDMNDRQGGATITEVMILAGVIELESCRGSFDEWATVEAVYRAMVRL